MVDEVGVEDEQITVEHLIPLSDVQLRRCYYSADAPPSVRRTAPRAPSTKRRLLLLARLPQSVADYGVQLDLHLRVRPQKFADLLPCDF